MRPVYLDYNASTPVAHEVRVVVDEAMRRFWPNPSSVHRLGQEARHELENAREAIAGFIGASPQEICFTSGATESNNLVIQGLSRRLTAENRNHVITSSIEHPSVMGPLEYLRKNRLLSLSLLPVSDEGLVQVKELEAHIRPNTGFASCMHVNHEVGTIQPVEEIARLLKERGILFHVDATQAIGKLSWRVDQIPCDFASFSGHKFYGPKGAGILYTRGGNILSPLMYGGHQERNLRPGTENVALCLGLAKAMEYVQRRQDQETRRLKGLKDRLYKGLSQSLEGVGLNGSFEHAVSNTLNLSFVGVEGEALVRNMDLEGLFVSTGSACTAGSLEPSQVLMAMGLSEAFARSSVRFSLGYPTQKEDIDHCLETIPSIVHRLRSHAAIAS